MVIWSTKDVGKFLGVNPHRLQRAIWDERLQAPAKGPGGVFLWSRADILRAGWAILRRDVSSLLLAEAEEDTP